jgi:hypothetical protein
LTLFITGLFGLFTLNTLAQAPVSARTRQSQKVSLENIVLQNYIDISSLSKDARKSFFGNLSPEEKANLFKLHLVLQLVKRPNLAKDQKDLIFESISTLTPNAYDKNNPEKLEKSRRDGELLGQKAKALFSKQEFFEIFANLGGGTVEINLLRKYLDVSALSVLERKDVFRKESAQDKSNLWRVHLAFHLAKQSGLNSRQMEIIFEAIIFATPEIYEISRDSSEWRVKVHEPIQLFTIRALEVFSKDEVAEIFSNLGGKKPSLRDTIASEDEMIPVGLCNCSRQWADCSGITFCTGLCEVPNPPYNCGFLDMYVCDGRCQ